MKRGVTVSSAPLGRGHDDPNCIWYRGQAACSGENNNTIRGKWISQSVTYWNVAPVDVGMGGYLKAHITYWSGTAVSVLAWANA